MNRVTLVGISGSLRKASFNTALLRAASELMPEGTTLAVHSIRDIPLYDGDVEAAEGLPAAVRSLKDAIAASGGLLLASPEYNASIPGVLKNAIDWLSRGPMPHGLFEVPTAILGASDGTIGTTRAQAILRQTLATLNAPAMPFPQVLMATAQKKFDAEGKLTDDATREFLRTYLVAVARWMRRFPRAERG